MVSTNTLPIHRCPHRNVTFRENIFAEIYHWCIDCGQRVKPLGFVLESQPLPDELALMDFAASLTRRETA